MRSIRNGMNIKTMGKLRRVFVIGTGSAGFSSAEIQTLRKQGILAGKVGRKLAKLVKEKEIAKLNNYLTPPPPPTVKSKFKSWQVPHKYHR